MLKIIQALCIVVWLTGCATTSSTRSLDAQGFSDAYVSRLQELAPSLSIAQEQPLILNLNNELVVSLDAAYREYRNDPTRLQELLDNYIQSVAEVVSAEFDTDLHIEQLLPVIKHKSYVDSAGKLQAQDSDATTGEGLYFESLNSELVVLFVQDNARSVRFLSRASVAQLGVATEQLRQRAVQNFRKRLSGVQSQQRDDVFLFQLDGFYEASLLLVDELWQSAALKVAGELLVTVPSRDILMFTGARSAHLAEMRSMAGDIAQRSAYAISPLLFVRRDNRWEVYP